MESSEEEEREPSPPPKFTGSGSGGLLGASFASFKNRLKNRDAELQKCKESMSLSSTSETPESSLPAAPVEKPTRGRRKRKAVLDLDEDPDEIVDVTPAPKPAPKPTVTETIMKKVSMPKRKRRQDRNMKELFESVDKAAMSMNKTGLKIRFGERLSSLFSPDDDDLAVVEPDKNPTITLKFKWRTNIIRILMREHQAFSSIYKQLAEEMAVDESQLVLMVKEKIIKPRDTPSTFDLGIADIVVCGIDRPKDAVGESSGTSNAAENDSSEDMLKIFLQTKDQKHKEEFRIAKNTPFSELRIEFATKKGVEASKVVFVFDGEDVDINSTPEDLDLDGEECFDVIIR